VLRAADVDRGGALRIGLGTVDVGPCGGMQDEVDRPEPGRRRRADVPVAERDPSDLVIRERLDKRLAELTVGAGD
jgi:hypothetical protein